MHKASSPQKGHLLPVLPCRADRPAESQPRSPAEGSRPLVLPARTNAVATVELEDADRRTRRQQRATERDTYTHAGLLLNQLFKH